jgi:hypothetical protein
MENKSQREHISHRIHFLFRIILAKSLWGHETRRTTTMIEVTLGIDVGRQSEIDDTYITFRTLRSKHDVLRFNVPMEDFLAT